MNHPIIVSRKIILPVLFLVLIVGCFRIKSYSFYSRKANVRHGSILLYNDTFSLSFSKGNIGIRDFGKFKKKGDSIIFFSFNKNIDTTFKRFLQLQKYKNYSPAPSTTTLFIGNASQEKMSHLEIICGDKTILSDTNLNANASYNITFPYKKYQELSINTTTFQEHIS